MLDNLLWIDQVLDVLDGENILSYWGIPGRVLSLLYASVAGTGCVTW